MAKLAKTGKNLEKTDKLANNRPCKQADKETNTEKQANINQFKHVIIGLESLIASESSNIQTDFDTVFLDTFPDLADDYQSRINKEMSEKENIASCCQNQMCQQNGELHENVQAQHHFNSDSVEACSDNDVCTYSDNDVCYQAIRLSEQLWNARDLVFGSFHQNDVRFCEQSRGYQCTCNALCMLSYAHCQ